MTPITILNQSNVPQGPFTRQEVAQKLAAREFTLDSLAHVEGLEQWTPLRDVLARVDAALPPPAVATPLSTPPAQTPAYSYAATMEPPSHLVYAGFWLRFVAIFIDGLILSPLAIISVFLNLGMRNVDSNDASAMLGLGVVSLVVSLGSLVIRWLYFSLMESSSWQATVGKRVMGLRVTTLEGQRIGFGRATGRFFGKIISGLTLMIGFIMAGFTDRKQALHDMIAGTLVVRN